MFVILPYPPLTLSSLQAHFHKEAAQLLIQLAKSEADSHAPPLRIKKLYVLAALEADQLKARMLKIGQQTSSGSPSRPSQALCGPSAAADTLAGADFAVAVAVDQQLWSYHSKGPTEHLLWL